jgi:predicted nucleic acid-binding protein
VLPFGEDEAEAFGLLCSLVREAGRQPRRRALDLQIAATAMVHDLPLLTRNAADLADIERAVTIVAV